MVRPMIHAFATLGEKQPCIPFQYPSDQLQSFDVLIQITHCGLCYSDVHLIDNDWQISRYPLVPGHEIIGHVVETGTAVNSLKKGMRVGVGWQSGSCFDCPSCIEGEETVCSKKIRTCVEKYGGFADFVVADSRFVYPIPESLSSETAAPLLCAGITVYSPLRTYHVQAPSSVAVLGIGGLGHLALQFAKAFGCSVSAISSSPEKEAEARKLGADRFFTLSSLPPPGTFDFILSTVHADLDWNLMIQLLKPKGSLCFVGIPQSHIHFPIRLLISGNKRVVGSGTGSRALMQEMLSFAARHQIKAQVELFPMAEINTAINKIKNNKIRYKAVLFN